LSGSSLTAPRCANAFILDMENGTDPPATVPIFLPR